MTGSKASSSARSARPARSTSTRGLRARHDRFPPSSTNVVPGQLAARAAGMTLFCTRTYLEARRLPSPREGRGGCRTLHFFRGRFGNLGRERLQDDGNLAAGRELLVALGGDALEGAQVGARARRDQAAHDHVLLQTLQG